MGMLIVWNAGTHWSLRVFHPTRSRFPHALDPPNSLGEFKISSLHFKEPSAFSNC